MPGAPATPPTSSQSSGRAVGGTSFRVGHAEYVSAQHAHLAERHGIRLSVGRRGQCWDNAVTESFFATIKTELLHRQAWPTRAAARQAIFEYVEGWYNTRRRHSSLGYLSPAAYETSATNVA